MKITITTLEAKALAYRAFNDTAAISLASKDDIEIVSDTNSNAPTIELVRLLSIVRNCGDYKAGNKIAAIKALREHCTNCGFFVGLADAKIFVESI